MSGAVLDGCQARWKKIANERNHFAQERAGACPSLLVGRVAVTNDVFQPERNKNDDGSY